MLTIKGPNDPDRKYRHLIKVLVKYDRARAHGGWPLYEDRDIASYLFLEVSIPALQFLILLHR